MGHAGRVRRMLGETLATAIIAGCTIAGPAPEITDPPLGAPFVACPASGEGAIAAPAGSTLVPPGSIAVGYTTLHYEGAPPDPCGAVFVEGASATVHRSSLPSPDIGVPLVASLVRPRPLVVHAPKKPITRVFRIDATGAVTFVDSQQLQDDPQYQAWGWTLPGAPVGKYRLQVVSVDGEVLAEGTFEIVE